MKIMVDAFGGDNAPIDVIKGCLLAMETYSDIELFISGNEKILKKIATENNIDISKIIIVDAEDVISVDEDPKEIRRSKNSSSMAVGLKTLKSGLVDAFVSAGSTGALVVGSSVLVGRIKGVKRAALAPVLRTDNGCFMILDAGANLDCRPEMFVQFGIMGSVYVKRVLGINNPRVGLANVGIEPSKGTESHKYGYELLSNCKYINFIGNMEARDMFFGKCDVIVCDGLSGNMMLKTAEGTSKFLIGILKEIFSRSIFTKLAALGLRKQIKRVKKTVDYREYGGAILLGISKPVIKAHGSSDANAFKNAINQARMCVREKIIDEMSKNISGSIGDE